MRAAEADTLRTDAERAEAFYNLGNAQFKQEQYKEALESYKQSLRFNPADEEAKYNYAYTKRLLQENRQDRQQDQNEKQDPNEEQQQNGQDGQDGQPEDGRQDEQEQPAEPEEEQGDERSAEAQAAPEGISPEEQERMLDAIQAQEDRTQEKLKEKQGVVVRGKKNW